jgi:hypothetical protein
MRRFFGYGVIVLALLGTLGINLYTLAQVARARTNVPWADQWVIVQDLMKRGHGEPLWPLLWTPYWGHRLVIPRLLFLADARWLSFGSLTWLTMLLQFIHIALLIVLAWLLLGRKSLALFMIGAGVILNLMLSPFQMENFVWGMQTMFPLVFAAATGSFLCLSRASATWRPAFLALSVALALISSYTMPNGILIWPVLVVQSIYLKQNWKVGVTLAGIGTVVIVSYLWHYTRPLEMGMGVGGVLRHPIDAILLLGLIVGSPFRFTVHADIALGVVALVTTGYIYTRALWSRSLERRWFSALFAVLLFLLVSSISVVAGRLTPADLHSASEDFMPGRYFTMICLCWVGIALLVLSTFSADGRAWLLCGYGMFFVCLMFTSIGRQRTEAEDWADFFRGADAVGSALLMDVPDDQLLSILWPSKPERDERILFLRQHLLAMFHEPRAAWMGKSVSDLFPAPPVRCTGAIEKVVDLNGSWRVSGWAWNTRASKPPDDVLFADSMGRVIGMARGGFRHGYMPGFLMEPQQSAPAHARFGGSEWLGYVKGGKDFQWARVGLYGVVRGEGAVCTIE